jgi:hypothetical protein
MHDAIRRAGTHYFRINGIRRSGIVRGLETLTGTMTDRRLSKTENGREIAPYYQQRLGVNTKYGGWRRFTNAGPKALASELA